MAEAKHVALVVLIVAVIVALATFISKQPGGWIETAEASVCSWRTAGDPTTNRVVKLSCSCPGKDEVKYSCQYVGVPEKTCPRFKTLVFEFFNQVLDTIKGERHYWCGRGYR